MKYSGMYCGKTKKWTGGHTALTTTISFQPVGAKDKNSNVIMVVQYA